MEQTIKSGSGWRIGWNPKAETYKGLLGTDEWAFELTEAELDEFCRLLEQLAETMSQVAAELMESERIACEAESDLLWLEAEGYHNAYSLRVILNRDRRCEGNWREEAVLPLLQASRTLKVF